MHEHSHTIIRLPVHLPSHQPVYFQPGLEEESLADATDKDTMLTAWFLLNQIDPDANNYLYREIPQHYVFRSNAWKKCQRGGTKVLPRMYTVSPQDQERFHLRMLLLHVPSATSFEDLHTVDGTVYLSFKEACLARQLLYDDTELENVMAESSLVSMPSQLRFVFATICAYSHPTHPRQLWESFQHQMTEDYARTVPPELAEQQALHDIEATLQQSGTYLFTSSLTVFKLHFPNHLFLYCGITFRLWCILVVMMIPYLFPGLSCSALGLPAPANDIDTGYDTATDATYGIDLLNTTQRHIYDVITAELASLQEPATRLYYVDGPGGTGKTTLYNTLVSNLSPLGYKVC